MSVDKYRYAQVLSDGTVYLTLENGRETTLDKVITESNKAFVLSVLPEKQYISVGDLQPSPDDYFNVGYDNAIDDIKNNAGIEAVTQPDGLRGGEK